MFLQNTLGEYVSGGFKNIDASKFPLTLRDLKLNEKRIQEDMDEDGSFPFEFSNGKIGSISVNPGWLGGVEVCATDIVLNFSFSAVRAMNWAMKAEEPEEEVEEEFQMNPMAPIAPSAMANQPVPPVLMAPRYCTAHDTSEKRMKIEPRLQECMGCHTNIQTSYADFTLCPGCSNLQKQCMICGASAPTVGSYVPAQSIEPQVEVATGLGMTANDKSDDASEDCPERRTGSTTLPIPPSVPITPRYCIAHNSTEKRIKIKPRLQECTCCRVNVQTSYANFVLCPQCSNEQQQCVICGASAPVVGSHATMHNMESQVLGASLQDLTSTANSVKPVHTTELPALSQPPTDFLALGLAAENQHRCMSRPWPQGGWVDSVPPPGTHRKASQIECGAPCAGDGSDGLTSIMKMFDLGSWMHCMADPGYRGKSDEDNCNERRGPPPPAQTWRGGA